jgi:hypothetical protein
MGQKEGVHGMMMRKLKVGEDVMYAVANGGWVVVRQ